MRLLLAVLVLAAASPPTLARNFQAPWTEAAAYVSAPDGDSVKVRTAARGVVSVRVAGIDAPERGQGYWRVARAHLVRFVSTPGLNVSCYKTDQYGRAVCRVGTAAGDLGASLLSAGLAWHYKRFQKEQGRDERELYARLEHQARERRIGLWQDPDPMPPELCRKRRRMSEKCR